MILGPFLIVTDWNIRIITRNFPINLYLSE